ncbi:hypothetical protein K402DRAFT_183662 [Aulographum hederae CBS 113979]|uniref:SH3 domain-containing protein n=1 Tax=Aulographum hederae CBS 113979 TaxID=1176131 RepID=A0A6G1GPR5_9PEZI|nr:hypothetical protein K402DRAFT_183662 [Aulographum hederae CBS 113979]
MGDAERRRVCRARAEGSGRDTAMLGQTSSSRPARRRRGGSGNRNNGMRRTAGLAAVAIAASLPGVAAQSCISLAGSEACPAFNGSSVSTAESVSGFPFLNFVSDLSSFDDRLRNYISTSYAQEKYQNLLGCSNLNLTNTTNLYARYTISAVCNAIVQNSIGPCSLSSEQSRPLCADSCADFATSEQAITASPDLCGTPGDNALSQIRADFTNCALPSDSLTGSCIAAVENEPNDCGYNANLAGLCSYCGSSSPNSTDSCCVNSNVESRCVGVTLPVTSSVPPLFPSSTSTAGAGPTSSSAPAGGSSGGGGLSGGAIAGIVVGSIVGALLLLALIIGCCWLARRRRDSNAGSIFNQPSPPRVSRNGPPSMTYNDGAPPPVIGSARIARMSALEGSTSSSNDRHGTPVAIGSGTYHSSSDEYDDSPESQRSLAIGGVVAPKRGGSNNSRSALGDSSSPLPPTTAGEGATGMYDSSPEGMASGQSEQLQFFKDYYSQDEIRPGDAVATLWAYQPRANDEFELERGDMLKVVGIWDDGWATGIKMRENAEMWESRRRDNRDSGVSHGSGRVPVGDVEGDIKAFPLVCVCLPQHWRKTIEGDTVDPSSSTASPPRPPPNPDSSSP